MNGIWKSPKVFNIITLYRSLLTAIPDNILSKPSLASPNTRDKKFLKTFLRGNPKYCWNYMALAGHFKRQNKDAWKTCLTRWFGLARINISRTLIQKWLLLLLLFFFNWDSPHARLNSHYEAWSYKKRSTKKITGYRKSV